jgi:hypothetical protein
MYICVTHVDSVTGVSASKSPTINGPKYPDIKGLAIEWWDESVWPTRVPKYYGTCDDDANLLVEGVVHVFKDITTSTLDADGNPVTETTTAQQQYDQAKADEMKARLPSVASARQIRLALLELGKLAEVQSFVEGLQEPMKTKVLIEWEYATEVRKNSPTIQELYKQMGWTKEQLDEVFVVAFNIQ